MATKAERGLATRRGIVEGAKRLFATHGYAEVSIEALLAATGLSRGAFYHHFAGKEAVFEAVVEVVEANLCREVIGRSAGARDGARAVVAGGEAFLDLAQDPAVRRIVLVDAPAVLGWARLREIQARHGFGLLRASLARAAAGGGVLAPARADLCAHILLAALGEAALAIDAAEDRAAAAAEAKAALSGLVAGLLGRAAV